MQQRECTETEPLIEILRPGLDYSYVFLTLNVLRALCIIHFNNKMCLFNYPNKMSISLIRSFTMRISILIQEKERLILLRFSIFLFSSFLFTQKMRSREKYQNDYFIASWTVQNWVMSGIYVRIHRLEE